ncbi:DUF5677 domain-containing protein [Gimesia aquarii]|uniref:Uncharacterized protein n=1 Tax=Gimesia aquarii TaxID=2527964 RepID=A0A517WWG3_9PLAN|nr:DUF5677 domain-containing protein [Gimesia aquarii]QDU09613.1 hypothetical protein V202x_29890 [Gimesia aquarii]
MFQDDLQGSDQTEKYHCWYRQMADAVSAALNSYLWVLGHVNEQLKATGKDTHLAAAVLLMEYADQIDGVAILAQKGSARNCVPLIRTGFELQLNLMYMVQRDDTFENRCLAYEFYHWVKQIKVALKCDPSSETGKQVRSQTKGELLADAFDHPSRNIHAEIAALQQMMDHARFSAVKVEYDRSKPKHWYGMWGGPGNIERLAAELGRRGQYEVMYRFWSGNAHGESALQRIDKCRMEMQPIRCPRGLPNACLNACNLANEMAVFLVGRFVPQLKDELAVRYLANVKPGLEFIKSVEGLDG